MPICQGALAILAVAQNPALGNPIQPWLAVSPQWRKGANGIIGVPSGVHAILAVDPVLFAAWNARRKWRQHLWCWVNYEWWGFHDFSGGQQICVELAKDLIVWNWRWQTCFQPSAGLQLIKKRGTTSPSFKQVVMGTEPPQGCRRSRTSQNQINVRNIPQAKMQRCLQFGQKHTPQPSNCQIVVTNCR